MKLSEYSTTGLPVHDIDLNEPPDVRWKALCRKEGKNIGRLLGDVVDMCVDQADRFPGYIRPVVTAAGKGTAMLGGWVVDKIAGTFGQEYVSEIRSIAKHAQQPLSHVMLGNLTYDLCQIGGIVGMGCSSYSCNIDGKPTLVRNMDWVWPRSTGRHSRLIRFHRGGDFYLSVGVLGCVGVVSAFRPGAWAVTINQAPMKGTRTRLLQWPVLQRLRHVCDRMGGYQEVVAGLREYETMTSFFAHVVGTKPKQHSVITGLGDRFPRRSMQGRALVQTNHFVGHGLERHNGPEEWEDSTGQWWQCDSRFRANSLTKRLKSVPGDVSEAHRRICVSSVTTSDTMQQMVFQPASGYSKVWLRP